MNITDKSKLAIYCGALKDISENTKEQHTKKQIEDIRIKIEIILSKDHVVKKELQ